MELIHNPDKRIELLKEYLDILKGGVTDAATYRRYEPILESTTAYEANSAIDALLQDAADVMEFAPVVARFIRSIGKGLEKQALPGYPKESLIGQLAEQNNEIKRTLENLQRLAKQLQQQQSDEFSLLIDQVRSFDLLKNHYVRLQNELFPIFEATTPQHSCVKLMWALEDRVLEARQKFLAYETTAKSDCWRLFGSFYVLAGMLAYREQYILLPAAFRAMGEHRTYKSTPNEYGIFSCKTGSLTFEELTRILSLLPLDLSFIDAEDRLRFYSESPNRVFVRTPQVIGRLVQNCHPPKSVATVEAILDSFKSGSADTAEFYLEMDGRFIHIQYYAVRSMDGRYLGCLEVTQDGTHLRSLTGQKRLL